MPHRIHEMQTIAIDDPVDERLSVCNAGDWMVPLRCGHYYITVAICYVFMFKRTVLKVFVRS